jgi:hypothetical protein
MKISLLMFSTTFSLTNSHSLTPCIFVETIIEEIEDLVFTYKNAKQTVEKFPICNCLNLKKS